MIEIRTFVGALDEAGLAAIADLYGRSDPKYRSIPYLRTLFVGNPYGWSVHAFAEDGNAAVGHCAAIPVRARESDGTRMSGKLEALFVAEQYRRSGQKGSGRSIALEVMAAVSDAALRRGLDPLHGDANPGVRAIWEKVGYSTHTTEPRPYVLAIPAPGAGVALRTLAAGQNAIASLVGAVTRAERTSVEAASQEDALLVEAHPGRETWTISGSDSWAWFTASGCVFALELPGTRGFRALVALHNAGQPLHLLGWRPNGNTAAAAAALLAALARIARQRSASSVRIQLWPGAPGGAALVRACRLMGFVPGKPMAVLVRSARSRPGEPAPSPFFYATF